MSVREKEVKDILAVGRKVLLEGIVSLRANFSHSGEMESTEEERNRIAKDDGNLMQEARGRFRTLMLEALARYTPEVKQSDIDLSLWDGHSAVAGVLEREMRRVVEVLVPIMRMAGFPLSTPDKRLRTIMENDWFDAQARFHEKAFSGLELPQRFGFHKAHGLLDYEPVSVGKDQYGYQCYIGDWSKQVYYRRPQLIVEAR